MDLNSDLGEGFGAWQMGDDAALLEIVTSANIACGFHAGDPAIMQRTARRAVELGISIGAHVSYPDLAGFGRRHVELPAEELAAAVLYQVGALDALARACGGRVGYVKPHGALYNEVAADPELAGTFATAIASYDRELPVLTLPDSAAAEAAGQVGIPCVGEGFADRSYEPDGSLTPRRIPGSVLHDPDEVAARAVRMARDGTVVARDGSERRLTVSTVCVHGDTPDAVRIARAVRDALRAADVELAPFATVPAS